MVPLQDNKKRFFTVALLGGPNSGKSSLFNRLTGLQQRVGNFPGVTVDKKVGNFKMNNGENAKLIDLPGTYTLYPHSEEERVTCNILKDRQHRDAPDLVIVVCDATQLRRGLVLVGQVLDLGLPIIVALNMNDLLAREKITLNTDLLAQKLQVPVIALSALTGQGIGELKSLISPHSEASPIRVFTPPLDLQRFVEEIKSCLDTTNDYRAYQALLQPNDFAELSETCRASIRQKILPNYVPLFISDEMLLRNDRAEALAANVLAQTPSVSERFSNKVDNIVLHRVGGYFIFGFILFSVFQAIFTWAAYPMDLIDGFFGNLTAWLHDNLPASWFTNLFADGIVAGIGGIVVFVPQIAFLFFFIALLEESGYMSRVMFLMDRLMRPFGFSGRSLVPLIGGMACAVPSIMMTRTIPNRQERLIAIMVTPLMSCSARIPIYVLLIGMFVPQTPVLGIVTLQGLAMMFMYVLGFITALFSAWVLKKILGYHNSGIYVSEMPIYRMPRWGNIWLLIYQKCRSFVTEAGKIILIISVVLWLAASFGPPQKMNSIDEKYDMAINANPEQHEILENKRAGEKMQASYAGLFGRTIEPIIRPLGFDWKIGIALLTSFAAREVFVGTMATLYSVGADDEENPKKLREVMAADINPNTGQPTYTPAVGFALLVFYAFAMQCMSTLAIAKRETGSWKWTIIMLVYMTLLAYVAAWVVYRAVNWYV